MKEGIRHYRMEVLEDIVLTHFCPVKSYEEVLIMNKNKSNIEYEVFNPWAEVDPTPLRGIVPRLAELAGKTVGLFANDKVAARPIMTVVERKLKERFPSLKFSWFLCDENRNVMETKDKERLKEWVKGIDAAVVAVGD